MNLNPAAADITQLIADWRAGSASALNILLPKLYAELRQLAASHLRGAGDKTLQPRGTNVAVIGSALSLPKHSISVPIWTPHRPHYMKRSRNWSG